MPKGALTDAVGGTSGRLFRIGLPYSGVLRMSGTPSTLGELRDFFFSDFIPLYDYLCSKLDRMPGELHYEIAAAFDHLMRSGLEFDGQVYERENIGKAAGHLKRATFDAFKLLYKNVTRPLWRRLTSSKYALDPKFVLAVNKKWAEAGEVVRKARGFERGIRGTDAERWSAAFEEWRKLRDITECLEQMSLSDDALCAKQKFWHRVVTTIGAMVLSAIVAKAVECLISFFTR